MKRKVAVVLLNLGSPASYAEVEPFLFSMFSDRYVIDLPAICRIPLAKLISKLRSPISKKIHSRIGEKSVLLEATQAQGLALEDMLNETTAGKSEYKVFVCMRHSAPGAHQVVNDVHLYGPDRVILLPMYPHYSYVTTQSSVDAWYRASYELGHTFNTHIVWHYYNNSHYIAAHCELLLLEYRKVLETHGTPPKILFSAHSIPLSLMRRGDQYEQHIKWNVELILQALKIPNLNSVLSYQSKITSPSKWLAPSTKQEIMKAAKDGVPVLLVPLSFTAENSETLVELDLDYGILLETGKFFRVPTLGTHPSFIQCLYKILREPEPL
ncbi:ferrochelatase [Anaplasma bovis]|uniref:ferrochelatase n=1 Tax=Anaplasma bovis TaxID=186733 RepID=UPI002FF2B66A